VLQRVAVPCRVFCRMLQRIAVCSSALGVYCSVLRRVSACCSVLQRDAVYSSVLQHGTACGMLQHVSAFGSQDLVDSFWKESWSTPCHNGVLQRVAVTCCEFSAGCNQTGI